MPQQSGQRPYRQHGRAASEAGDYAQGVALQHAALLPYATPPQQQLAVHGRAGYLGGQAGPWAGGEDKCWFDPLYIEDPLRPQNNVGRNCFRISQIQQAFAQAYTELLHRGPAQASGEARAPGSVLALVLLRPLHQPRASGAGGV